MRREKNEQVAFLNRPVSWHVRVETKKTNEGIVDKTKLTIKGKQWKKMHNKYLDFIFMCI